jgi:hypothetical protein
MPARRTTASPSTKPRRKPIPFPFVLEALAPLDPEVRPMFSGHCVYIADKAVLMLRDSPKATQDNGLWLIFSESFDATNTPKALHHKFPSLRPIQLLNGKIKHWLLLPSDAEDFETEALQLCDLLLAHDPRLGRIPKSRTTPTNRKPK